MTYDLTRRVAPLCALFSLAACTTAQPKTDGNLAEKEDAEPVVAETPEAPPSFCGEGTREVEQRDYHWCARGDTPHGPYVVARGGVTLLEGEFVDGYMSGEWTSYHEGGERRWSGAFEAGEEAGLLTAWREDGSKLYTITFTEGVPDGPTTYYHGNGERSAEVSFSKGKPEGTWVYWHENGEMAHRLSWKDGKESIHEHWTARGKKQNAPVGSLPKGAVQRIANSIDDQVIDCYKHIRAFEQAEGRLVVQFTVDYSGDVNRVAALSNDFTNPFMASCTRRAIEALEFPLNPYGPQRVIRTWSLGVE